MTRKWKEALRRELEVDKNENSSPEDESAVAYLKFISNKWGSELGIGDLTIRFFLETQPLEKGSVTFETRLVETMRHAGEVRKCLREARSLLESKRDFGLALRWLIDKSSEETIMQMPGQENIAGAKKPQDIGIKRLKDIAQLTGVKFLELFCLVACSFEQDFMTAKNLLMVEGLARTKRGLSKKEQQKQAEEIAVAVLKPKREESLAFLEELASAVGGDAI